MIHMVNVNVSLTDEEYGYVFSAKGNKTWKEFILDSAKLTVDYRIRVQRLIDECLWEEEYKHLHDRFVNMLVGVNEA